MNSSTSYWRRCAIRKCSQPQADVLDKVLHESVVESLTAPGLGVAICSEFGDSADRKSEHVPQVCGTQRQNREEADAAFDALRKKLLG
jgi:hypothetical protein